MKLKTSVVLVAAALSTGAFADGQQEEKMQVVGKQSGYQAENVSSMKVEATQLETPGSISVFDESLMEEQGAQTLGDVLKNDASISAGNTRRNRERFIMRGFELEPDQSYLRNGQFHLANYMLPIELYERVEVLKGPSSLLYGKSTPGGMINFVTKRAKSDFHVNLHQEFGAHNHLKSMMDIGGALNDDETVRARLIASKSTQESYRRHKDGSPLESERLVGGVIVEADLGDRGLVSFIYDRTQDNGHVDMGSAFIDGKLVGTKDFVWDMPWAKRESDVENIGLTVDYALTHQWAVSTGLNRQNTTRRTIESNWGKIFNESSSNPIYNPTTRTWRVMAQDTYETFKADTAFLDFKGDLSLAGMQHQVLVGASYVDYSTVKQQHRLGKIGDLSIDDNKVINKPSDLDYRNGKANEFERETLGLYVQDYVEVNDQWSVLAGVRFDQEKTSNSNSNNVLPKAAVIYSPSYDSSVYLTYSQSFEPKDPVAPKYENAGQELDAERGELFELGAKKEYFDGQMLVTAALFNIEKNNKVVEHDGTGSKKVIKQDGSVRHRGLELSVDGQLTDKLSLQSNLMLLDARYIETPNAKLAGKRAKDAPKVAAGVWANYQINDMNNVHIGARYEGQKFGDPYEKFNKPAYTLVDLGYTHRIPMSNKLDGAVRVNVSNLFNQEYLRGGCGHNAIYGDGRTVKATFQLNW
ncbi:TonB-dependent siderophore receptor [Vibrio sp. SCSIO 43136]|uniref:TonB-dependent siderophore receptor n=1 Tax=Vibrio sp. SCSIO 43136 TaxID=2819101 RepID=UPI0020750FF3|nr:TonB-dependent siderophore receptor [Vibrio sp. SCSIO 43136]USD65708.1 TonB-dependent siderophore receptor [Vibrio sp. SCSIO 43136]